MSNPNYEVSFGVRPETLSPVIYEPLITKQCRRCGVDFETRSRIRKRCDTCQTIVTAEKQKKANARQRARRQKFGFTGTR